MPAIILAIIAALIPVVAEWLRKWIESRLERAASGMPELTSFASETDAACELLDRAIDELPVIAFARRRLLRRVKEVVRTAGITSAGFVNPIPESDLAAIASLAESAANE